MSIKAKIEAIIYAAEEPVTIDQMATLLRNDVLSALADEERAAADKAAERSATEESPVAIAESAETAAISAEVPATGSDEPSETRAHEERAPSLTEVSEEASPVEIAESGETPAEAPERPVTASEEPTEARAHEERASDTTESTNEGAATQAGNVEPTTEAEQEASTETSAPEPVTAEASTSAPANPKKRKSADPELPRVRQYLRRTLQEMLVSYADEDRGIEIRAIAGGFRMATKPEHHDVVRAFAKSLKPAIKLSLQALETLAVIAYKQPVTVPEISEIRGVDSGGVIATLLERKLITTAGRKAVIGRPILYKTTKEFLLRFGLNELGELPSMEEFEKLAQEQTDLFDENAAPENQPVPPPDEPTAEEMDGDVSDGADTAESIVRAQIGEDAGVAEEPMPEGAGDRSSGADTAESVVREQVEEEKQD